MDGACSICLKFIASLRSKGFPSSSRTPTTSPKLGRGAGEFDLEREKRFKFVSESVIELALDLALSAGLISSPLPPFSTPPSLDFLRVKLKLLLLELSDPGTSSRSVGFIVFAGRIKSVFGRGLNFDWELIN